MATRRGTWLPCQVCFQCSDFVSQALLLDSQCASAPSVAGWHADRDTSEARRAFIMTTNSRSLAGRFHKWLGLVLALGVVAISVPASAGSGAAKNIPSQVEYSQT